MDCCKIRINCKVDPKLIPDIISIRINCKVEMLPGVEYARRRRLYQSRGQPSSLIVAAATTATATPRRSSFCLYPTHHATTSSSFQSRNIINQAYGDEEELGGVAREAKQRLDERLRTHRNPETIRRHDDGESSRATKLQLQTMVHGMPSVGRGSGSSNSKRFSWGKMRGWRATEQDECAICLERFEVGETLVHLPCAHRFHSRCLVPWLEAHAQCPCCRMGISP